MLGAKSEGVLEGVLGGVVLFFFHIMLPFDTASVMPDALSCPEHLRRLHQNSFAQSSVSLHGTYGPSENGWLFRQENVLPHLVFRMENPLGILFRRRHDSSVQNIFESVCDSTAHS